MFSGIKNSTGMVVWRAHIARAQVCMRIDLQDGQSGKLFIKCLDDPDADGVLAPEESEELTVSQQLLCSLVDGLEHGLG